MTHTLDLSGAAFATAQVAAKLGDTASRDTMMALVANFGNAFDAKTGLLNPKGSYYEGTLWNYSFRILPDMAARIKLCPGGKDQLVALLDSFFGFTPKGLPKNPATQMPILPWQHKGSLPEFVSDMHAAGAAAATYEGLNNEPDMETPYSYAYVGRMDRLAEVIFGVKSFMFAPGRGGLACEICCLNRRPPPSAGTCPSPPPVFPRMERCIFANVFRDRHPSLMLTHASYR